MYWGFGCISTASAKQGCRSDAATAFATSVDPEADVTDPTGLTDIRPAPRLTRQRLPAPATGACCQSGIYRQVSALRNPSANASSSEQNQRLARFRRR